MYFVLLGNECHWFMRQFIRTSGKEKGTYKTPKKSTSTGGRNLDENEVKESTKSVSHDIV